MVTVMITTRKIGNFLNAGKSITNTNKLVKKYYHRRLTNSEIQQKRVTLFEKEQKRQSALITDIEKIEVKYVGPPEDCVLIMNKNLSTPYHCAQHMNKAIMERSVLAEVNGELWDMFTPLTGDCKLRFLHFKEYDPYYVNKCFWRGLSLMLGAVVESAFKDDIQVQLCSFPAPNVRSGSFVYDIDLGLESWQPTEEELRVLSAEMIKLSLANHPFHRLEVDASVALNMFEDNFYKKSQIPHIAVNSETGNTVTLYRCGSFIDLSRGPVMSHTSHVGKCTITGVHLIHTDRGDLWRFQGVGLPRGIKLNFYTYGILENRGRKLNSGRLPSIASFEAPLQPLKQKAVLKE